MIFNQVLILGNMKKLLFILLLFLPLTAWSQSHYYVATYGADVVGGGTLDAPWATLRYAITRVTTAWSTIHVEEGTYPPITSQMLLSNGVSIEGAGRESTIIPLTYSAGKPCIKLETGGGWENKSVGNQHISGIKFVGSTTPGVPVGKCAIGVNFRHHVEIYDCWFEDFDETAVWFQGEPTYSLDDDEETRIDNPYEMRSGEESAYLPYSDSFCEGNKFYNNEVHNCCKELNHTTHNASGAIELSMQDGFEIYGNNMTALGRSSNYNGVPIKMVVGFNRNVKIHNNTINAGHKNTNYWQFSIEVWWDLGGLEIYNNTLSGSIDLCHQWDLYAVGYGAKIYGNDIGYPTSTTNIDYGIRLEDHHISCYIYKNKIHHVAVGIEVNNAVRTGAEIWDGVYICDNLMVELSGNNYQTWGILWQSSIINHVAVWKNTYIQHNTIVASASAPAPTYYGIMLPTVQDFDGLYIENNILVNWERGAIYGSGTRIQATNFFIRNNLIYDSYNNNEPVNVNSYPTAGITYVRGPQADPLFISPPSNYRLQALSPAIGAGRYLYLTWFPTDFDGNGWMNPPSIGAYEASGSSIPTVYTTFITNITETTAQSGGQIDSDGGEAITARGVCWSTSSGPTTAGDKTTDGTGTGTFTSSVTGLTNGQTYYLRAYATNSIGTAYGLERVFTTPIPTSSGVRFIEHNGVLIIHNGKFVKSD
jgi:hypothetical protein